MQVVGLSDIGKKRKHNEDFFIIDQQLGLYIVCDGVGGHAAGEIASKEAACAVQRYVQKHHKQFVALVEQGTPESSVELTKLAVEAVQYACQSVYELAQGGVGRKGMGTTLTMLLVLAQKGLLAHVGDSRFYLCRDGEIHQISKDHTYVDAMLQDGFTLEEALQSPYANTITRAVGIEPRIKVDTLLMDILPRDVLLLCSDGLHNYLQDDQILKDLLAQGDVEKVAHNAIDFANQHGGQDNITVIVMKAEDETEESDVQKTKQVRLKLDTLKAIALFDTLTLNEMSTVLSSCVLKVFVADSRVIEEGTPGDILYVLLEGSVTLSRDGAHLCELSAGSHFGEMALINNCPRSATVTTNETSLFLTFSREHFECILRSHHEVANKILLAVAKELSKRLNEDTLDRISQ